MSFNQFNLDSRILDAIKISGYSKPTPIQEQSIPPVLEGHDVVACAQTGTGKTAAFMLPALDLLKEKKKGNKARVLVLTPTRELSSQIVKAGQEYSRFLPVRYVNLVGGMPYHQQIRKLNSGCDIIVATPGRLLDHIRSKRLDLSSIEMLILDEADRMLDMGFIDDIKQVASLIPKDRQTLLFSATIEKRLGHIISELLNDPVNINISPKEMTAPKIEQKVIVTNNLSEKYRLLEKILAKEQIFKGIIFTATKKQADSLADELDEKGFNVDALHGDMKQNQRNRTVEKLRKGRIQLLVATDVAARGIDIDDITHVINFDLPHSREDYVHRIGRTGRADKSGIAISFVSPKDRRSLESIEHYLGQKLLTGKDAKAVASKSKRPKKKKSFKSKPFEGKRREGRKFKDGHKFKEAS